MAKSLVFTREFKLLVKEKKNFFFFRNQIIGKTICFILRGLFMVRQNGGVGNLAQVVYNTKNVECA